MRLVPVFTLETNNQTNNECLPKFVQTHNASSSIKAAIYTNISHLINHKVAVAFYIQKNISQLINREVAVSQYFSIHRNISQ